MKISEKKALEAYPIDIIPDDDALGLTPSDRNEDNDIIYGYIKGYDQAMQDFLEKAVEWLQDSLDRRYVVRNFHTGEYYSIQDMIKDFKNYMQNESKD